MKSGYAVFIMNKCRFVKLAEDPTCIEVFPDMATAEGCASLVGEPTKIVPCGPRQLVSVLR